MRSNLAVLADGPMTSQEIAARLDINMTMTSGAVARMVDRGIIRPANSFARPIHWTIADRKNDGAELLRHWPPNIYA